MNYPLIFGLLGVIMVLVAVLGISSQASEPKRKIGKDIDPDYTADQIMRIMNGSAAGSEPDENDWNVPLGSE